MVHLSQSNLVLQYTCIKIKISNILILTFLKKKITMNQIIYNNGTLFNYSSIFIDISSSLLLFDIDKGEEIEFDIGKVKESG